MCRKNTDDLLITPRKMTLGEKYSCQIIGPLIPHTLRKKYFFLRHNKPKRYLGGLT